MARVLSVSQRDFYGSARHADLAAAEVLQLWPRRSRVITVTTTGASAVVRLADATEHRWLGYPKHYIFNDASSTDPVLLHDRDGTLLRTIPVGEMVKLSLEEQAAAAGVWGVTQPVPFGAGGAFI